MKDKTNQVESGSGLFLNVRSGSFFSLGSNPDTVFLGLNSDTDPDQRGSETYF